jgi:hypothetical protein
MPDLWLRIFSPQPMDKVAGHLADHRVHPILFYFLARLSQLLLPVDEGLVNDEVTHRTCGYFFP